MNPKSGSIQFWFGVAITLVGWMALTLSRAKVFEPGTAMTAGIASTGFLVAASTPTALGNWFGRWILLGLIGCWFGDVLGPHNFLLGVYAFMAAHFGFVIACWVRGLIWSRVAKATIPTLIVSVAVGTALLSEASKEEQITIWIYTFIISVMVIAAYGASQDFRWLFIAAVAFYLSDVLLGLWRYGGNSIYSWFCYPVYYSACLMFAYSGWRGSIRTEVETATG
ncbi:MAG: hypothetical protein KC964_19270 [Candidatus Omnitrophica bacterium]|nr:hypothetical protein [Candidatus Omnitrophota bacterium]